VGDDILVGSGALAPDVQDVDSAGERNGVRGPERVAIEILDQLQDLTRQALKSFSWDVMDRLHATELITDPKSSAKSALLTDEGFDQAQDEFKKPFYRTA
jgi:hypothetical protein